MSMSAYTITDALVVCMCRLQIHTDREHVESAKLARERRAGSGASDVESGVYFIDFETPFLAQSAEWFKSKGDEWVALTAPEFATRVEVCYRTRVWQSLDSELVCGCTFLVDCGAATVS